MDPKTYDGARNLSPDDIEKEAKAEEIREAVAMLNTLLLEGDELGLMTVIARIEGKTEEGTPVEVLGVTIYKEI